MPPMSGGAAVATLGEFSDVVEEDSLLSGSQMGCVLRDLGEEGISEENGRLIAVTRGRIPKKGGDIHLEGAREAVQRGQGGHSLGILDFRDVGARHPHASCELTLGEIPHVAEVPHSRCHLRSTLVRFRGRLDVERSDSLNLWRLGQQGFLAAAACV